MVLALAITKSVNGTEVMSLRKSVDPFLETAKCGLNSVLSTYKKMDILQLAIWLQFHAVVAEAEPPAVAALPHLAQPTAVESFLPSQLIDLVLVSLMEEPLSPGKSVPPGTLPLVACTMVLMSVSVGALQSKLSALEKSLPPLTSAVVTQ
jgi:hypothetical protein